jgi:hypothetical protein
VSLANASRGILVVKFAGEMEAILASHKPIPWTEAGSGNHENIGGCQTRQTVLS